MTDIRASQAIVLAAGNYSAENVAASQAQVLAAVGGAGGMDIRASQSLVLVAALGRVSDPRVRAWPFTLDEHSFYVLRLGNSETLLYEETMEDWYVWGSGESDLWRAYTGCNWLGGRRVSGFSNIVVGDDGNGALYFLAPDHDYDDDALLGDASPRSFTRVITGQLHLKGYDSVPCYGVQLLGSIGETVDDGLTVNLSISDDRGYSYVDMGDLTVGAEDYVARLNWQSLGSMTAPGRLFRVSDAGMLRRIDSLTMEGDDGAQV